MDQTPPTDPADVLELQAEIRRLQALAEARLALAQTGGRRVGRNDPCPCGSGRKFKRCCLVAIRNPVLMRGMKR